MTGSISVITMNLNRIIQQAVKDGKNYLEEIRGCVRKVHKYQKAEPNERVLKWHVNI